MKSRKRVAYCLYGWGCKSCALANIQVRKTFLFVPGLYGCPNFMLVLYTALCERIHGPVGNILAIVQTKGPQVKAVVRQCNYTLIWWDDINQSAHRVIQSTRKRKILEYDVCYCYYFKRFTSQQHAHIVQHQAIAYRVAANSNQANESRISLLLVNIIRFPIIIGWHNLRKNSIFVTI